MRRPGRSAAASVAPGVDRSVRDAAHDDGVVGEPSDARVGRGAGHVDQRERRSFERGQNRATDLVDRAGDGRSSHGRTLARARRARTPDFAERTIGQTHRAPG